jgi:hypothetical protein
VHRGVLVDNSQELTDNQRILISRQRLTEMPVTKSEMLFFAAGAVLGAAAGASFPYLKEKFGPLLAAALAGASSTASESCAEVAKHVAERVEAMQDAMAEIKHSAGSNGTAETTPV